MTPCPACGIPHDREVLCLRAAQATTLALLKNIGDPGQCRACQAEIFWVIHRNGKKAPYTAAGLNHFVDCPAAARFKQPRAAEGPLRPP